MLSCVWFAHPLSWEQWIGAVSISSLLCFFLKLILKLCGCRYVEWWLPCDFDQLIVFGTLYSKSFLKSKPPRPISSGEDANPLNGTRWYDASQSCRLQTVKVGGLLTTGNEHGVSGRVIQQWWMRKWLNTWCLTPIGLVNYVEKHKEKKQKGWCKTHAFLCCMGLSKNLMAKKIQRWTQ